MRYLLVGLAAFLPATTDTKSAKQTFQLAVICVRTGEAGSGDKICYYKRVGPDAAITIRSLNYPSD